MMLISRDKRRACYCPECPSLKAGGNAGLFVICLFKPGPRNADEAEVFLRKLFEK